MNAHKPCEYPLRERKVALLESQFQKIKQRVKLLEQELHRSRQGLVDLSIENDLGGYLGPLDSESIRENQRDYILPFELQQHTGLGAASCQVFDDSLSAYLSKITQQSQNKIADPSDHSCRVHSQNAKLNELMMLPEKQYGLFLIRKTLDFLGHEFYLINPHVMFHKVEATYGSGSEQDPAWLCYLLVVLAVGEQYLTQSTDGDTPGMRFFAPAMQLFKTIYATPSLQTIQTLLLFAFYHQGLNCANGAFAFYGLAIRNCLLLGLHKPNTSFSATETEERRRVWWSCFIMDSLWSLSLGQPVHVLAEEIDIDFPDVDPVDLDDQFDYQVQALNAKAVIMMTKALTTIYGEGQGRMNLKTMVDSIAQLDDFVSSLISKINQALLFKDRTVANLYLRLNHMTIVSIRPLVLSNFKQTYDYPDTQMLMDKCITAAKSSIDILTNLKQTMWFSTLGFWDAQYIYTCITILTICNVDCEQLTTGKQLLQYMTDAGNFTAQENTAKLQQLHQLLEKLNPKKPIIDHIHAQQTDEQIKFINQGMNNIVNVPWYNQNIMSNVSQNSNQPFDLNYLPKEYKLDSSAVNQPVNNEAVSAVNDNETVTEVNDVNNEAVVNMNNLNMNNVEGWTLANLQFWDSQ